MWEILAGKILVNGLHACMVITNVKQKYLGCKKGKANQKQQLSDYIYMQPKALVSASYKAKN